MMKVLMHGFKAGLASLVLFGVMQFSGQEAFAAVPLPGKIEAENWTQMSGVATESCADTGGGLDVGGINNGDWMDYSVNVSAAGDYKVQFRTASTVNTGVIQLRKADGTVLGTVQVPNTGGWQSWTTVSTTVTLPAGTQTLRVYAQSGNWNINWLNFIKVPTLPGQVEAENWTQMSGVATESCTDTGGGLDVGGINDGDWMDYSVNVSAAGDYKVQFRTASTVNTGVIQLRKADGTVLGTVQVPNTGGWQLWTTVSTTVTLPAGTQTLRIYAQSGNWNINWFQALSGQDPQVLPNLQGKILYSAYSDYNAGDSQLYLLKLSLADRSVNCLSCGWSNVYNAMNGHFSPDGTKVTFMGYASGTTDWDVWLYTFGDALPVNLTNSGGATRNEDPKFSPNGSKIVFKQKQASVFSIKEMNLSGSILNTVSSGSVETSMPYYTTDGQSILYTPGSTATDFDIRKVNTDGTGDVGLVTTANVSEYYPIVRDASTFIYTSWVNASNHHDQIYLKNFSGGSSLMLFNEPNSDYSDPYPAGSSYVLVSSDRPGGKGGYDLYLADINSGQIWSLDQYNSSVNSANHELGSSYTPY